MDHGQLVAVSRVLEPVTEAGSLVLRYTLDAPKGFHILLKQILFGVTTDANVGNRTLSVSHQDSELSYNIYRFYLMALAASSSTNLALGHGVPSANLTSGTSVTPLAHDGLWLMEGERLQFQGTSVFAGDRVVAKGTYELWRRRA